MKYYPILDTELAHMDSAVISTSLFASLASASASMAVTLWLTRETIPAEELAAIASGPGFAAIRYGWAVCAVLALLFGALGVRAFLEKGSIVKKVKKDSRQAHVVDQQMPSQR